MDNPNSQASRTWSTVQVANAHKWNYGKEQQSYTPGGWTLQLRVEGMKAYLPILHPFLNINSDEIPLPFIFHIWTLLTDLNEQLIIS